ncbi:hypothetical protein PsunGV_gp154 [Pseudalatia unipuncta granulovirus]|uniref:Uncharacterized protein n=1 Tax=Pseudalatia unipuncta granulosis virus TaxID=36355 RepID=B6S723_GVPU|nr:hypothetical protein PsunGV_gp154 [Pseudalatia unipuncta granulovirus]ACH69504.1 unknown [Pseudalatia unipuncta granulovirus]
MDFALVSVWYNKDKFIYNTTCHPFWHNILYYSQYFKYYVLYYIENESEAKIPPVGPVKFINFKDYAESKNVSKLKHVMNKIDYMKLHFIFNSKIVPETFVLLMDMDCQLSECHNLKFDKLKNIQYYLTPYTDSSTKCLYRPMSSYDKYENSFDSYIENYATFINKTKPFFQPWHGVDIRVENETNQFFMYAQYLQIVQLYMGIFHQHALPTLYKNYKISNPIKLTFHRGSSYRGENDDEYKYEYDYRKPAIFGKQSLTHQLYIAIISEEDQETIKNMLHNLHRLGYNFESKFHWSNSLQCDVNVCGVIEDRCVKKNKFDYTGVEFVKPIKMYK